MGRIIFHYLAAFVLLTFYGGRVCPYVDSLTLTQWGSESIIVLGMALLAHLYVHSRLAGRAPIIPSDIVFKTSLGIFLASGLAAGAYNYFLRGFPAASGMKLLVGWFLVGFYMALDLTLHNRQNIIKYLLKTGQNLEMKINYASLTRKFLIFAVLTSLAVLVVIFLVIIKDLDWIFSTNPNPMHATLSVLKEFLFIFMVIMGYNSMIAVSFTKNLRSYLHNQNDVLNEVVNGNLNVSVPVSSMDEFGHMAKYTNEMIKSLRDRTEALQLTQDVSILSLASLAETRDNETGGHIMRTQRYVMALADVLKQMPEFKDELTDENINLIYKSAPLHDIGKVGIPDSILLKPGKLTEDEFKIMRRHPYYGKKALHYAGQILGKNSFLKFSEEISYTHHEKWDGTGYPRRLKGNNIPLSGRMMAVADVYDALISARVYKPAFSHEKAKAIILEGSGTHFDPKLVEAFILSEEQFIAIAGEFSDENYKKSVTSGD